MIIFKKISWRNFLSTGDKPTIVFFDRSSTTLIIGENGSGKSTILDALTFGLFGKPFRNINKPQLVNAINEKELMVEIDFSIGKKDFTVRRGVKPNVFEIFQNGKMFDQTANVRDYQDYLERVILKLNYKSFTQIVLLGNSSFEPFMQLKQSDRRAIVEDLLDIQIFSSMNMILKQKNSELKGEIQQNENQRKLNESQTKMQQEYIERLKQVISFAVDEGYLFKQHETMIDRARPPRGEETEIQIPSEESVAKLIGACSGFWKATVLIFASTGIRFGEYAALPWKNVHFNNKRGSNRRDGYIRITQARQKKGKIGPPKGKKNREVPISEELADLLME